MTKNSRESFEERLSSNSEFMTEFTEYQQFTFNLESSLNHEIMENIKQGEITYQKQKIFRGLGLFLITLVAGLALIHYLSGEKEVTETTPRNNSLAPDTITLVTKEKPKKTPPDSNIYNQENKTLAIKSSVPKPIKKAPIKIDSVIFTEFKQVTSLSIKKGKENVLIHSPTKVKQIICFKRDNRSYVSVDGLLFLETKSGYKKEKNLRLLERISRSSGKGKKQTFKVYYYTKTSSKKPLLKSGNKTYFKNDTIFRFKENMILPTSVYKFEKPDIYDITERFFTVEDIMNLEGNN